MSAELFEDDDESSVNFSIVISGLQELAERIGYVVKTAEVSANGDNFIIGKFNFAKMIKR